MANEHRINRDRRPADAETYECKECGETFSTQDRLDRHRDRKKRERLRGNPIGETILEYDRQTRGPF